MSRPAIHVHEVPTLKKEFGNIVSAQDIGEYAREHGQSEAGLYNYVRSNYKRVSRGRYDLNKSLQAKKTKGNDNVILSYMERLLHETQKAIRDLKNQAGNVRG